MALRVSSVQRVIQVQLEHPEPSESPAGLELAGSLETVEIQVRLVPLDCQESLDRLDCLELSELAASRVSTAPLDLLGPRDQLVYKVRRVRMGQLVSQESPVQAAQLESMDQSVKLDRKGLEGYQDFQDRQEVTALAVRRVQRVKLDSPVESVLLEVPV